VDVGWALVAYCATNKGVKRRVTLDDVPTLDKEEEEEEEEEVVDEMEEDRVVLLLLEDLVVIGCFEVVFEVVFVVEDVLFITV
tara:strand:+ start:1960 stop:2208 length:249 start_codon:yes stop_codon:yes gene_type:complete